MHCARQSRHRDLDRGRLGAHRGGEDQWHRRVLGFQHVRSVRCAREPRHLHDCGRGKRSHACDSNGGNRCRVGLQPLRPEHGSANSGHLYGNRWRIRPLYRAAHRRHRWLLGRQHLWTMRGAGQSRHLYRRCRGLLSLGRVADQWAGRCLGPQRQRSSSRAPVYAAVQSRCRWQQSQSHRWLVSRDPVCQRNTDDLRACQRFRRSHRHQRRVGCVDWAKRLHGDNG